MKYIVKKPEAHKVLGKEVGSTPIEGEIFQLHEYPSTTLLEWFALENLGYIEKVETERNSTTSNQLT